MRDENVINLQQFRRTPLEQVAAWPPTDLIRLVNEIAAVLQEAKMAKAFLEGALAHKYAKRADAMRRETGKPTGVVRFDDGAFTIINDVPKKPEWDQEKLAAIADEIRRDGVDPAHYLDTVFKVQERRFTAWPPHIQAAFQAARTLKIGKPTFKIERDKPQGGF